MAIRCGYFNSKNSDRVYTAEDFNDYLSGLICNGVFGNYGDCFKVTANSDLTVTVGTGKAWIDGHYFISDTPYVIDLSSYVQAASATNILIGISCDTAENARMCKFEISVASFSDTETKKFLTLAEIQLSAGATTISKSDITDHRDDESKCGYVKCILGKCHVSDILDKLNDYNKTVTELNQQVSELQKRLTEVEEVTGATGVDIDIQGQCGQTAYYILYTNGSLKLTGTGETFSYNYYDGLSPFYQNQKVKNISVASGISTIGDYMFAKCDNLENITLPETIVEIRDYSFAAFIANGHIRDATNGIKKISIPNSVKYIGEWAFYGTRLTEITIPSKVFIIGDYAFACCARLTTARVETRLIGNYMFSRCTSLSKLTISTACKKFGSNMLTDCKKLETIDYEGTMEEWNQIEKQTNWICEDYGNNYHNGYLQEIKCTDGSLIWSDGKFVVIA